MPTFRGQEEEPWGQKTKQREKNQSARGSESWQAVWEGEVCRDDAADRWDRGGLRRVLALSHRKQRGLDRNSFGSIEEGTPDLRETSVSGSMAE